VSQLSSLAATRSRRGAITLLAMAVLLRPQTALAAHDGT
jgi:hypothetical protein